MTNRSPNIPWTPDPPPKNSNNRGPAVTNYNSPWTKKYIFYKTKRRVFGYMHINDHGQNLLQVHPEQTAPTLISIARSPTKKNRRAGVKSASPCPRTNPPNCSNALFATSPSPIAESLQWAARLPQLRASALEQEKPPVSLPLSCYINNQGSVSVISSPVHSHTPFVPTSCFSLKS